MHPKYRFWIVRHCLQKHPRLLCLTPHVRQINHYQGGILLPNAGVVLQHSTEITIKRIVCLFIFAARKEKRQLLFFFLREVVKTAIFEKEPPNHKIDGGLYRHPSHPPTPHPPPPPFPQMVSLLHIATPLSSSKNDNRIQSSLFLFIQQCWLLQAEYFWVKTNFKAKKILSVMFMR